jgi:integrase
MNRRQLLRCGALAGLAAVFPAAIFRRALNDIHNRQESARTHQRGSAGPARLAVHTWDAEQVGLFLKAIDGHRLHPLYHLAAYTGMRRGELCGLSWDDVDLDAGRITVRWQIAGGQWGRSRSRPKTVDKTGVVDLDEATAEVLRTWREQQRRERAGWAPGHAHLRDEHGPYRLVFTRENGSPLDPRSVSRQFARLTELSGLGHRALDGLRAFAMSCRA